MGTDGQKSSQRHRAGTHQSAISATAASDRHPPQPPKSSRVVSGCLTGEGILQSASDILVAQSVNQGVEEGRDGGVDRGDLAVLVLRGAGLRRSPGCSSRAAARREEQAEEARRRPAAELVGDGDAEGTAGTRLPSA